MRGERNTDKNVRKFITITDMSLWEKIDKIMTLPEYEKSFNKVINHALFYGLDTLYTSLFEQEEICNEGGSEVRTVRRIDGLDDGYFLKVIRLLKEIIVNETINKSMLSALFRAKSRELNGEAVNGKLFGGGKLNETPECLERYELQSLAALNKEE